jgi:hypothetical protein
VSFSWPWVSLVALGAFHGLNPAMGWLFAVALGMQERRLGAVAGALGPIALGHALAIGLVAAVVSLAGFVVPQRLLLTLGGVALLVFAVSKVVTRFRHPQSRVGMRVGPRALVLWSFLMATAHGAGLMLVPVLVELRGEGVPSAIAESGHRGHTGHAAHAGHGSVAAGDPLTPTLAAVGLHSAAMLAVAAVIAVVVYQKVGVEVLRRAWVNLDLIWVGVLGITGGITLGLGLWPLLTA